MRPDWKSNSLSFVLSSLSRVAVLTVVLLPAPELLAATPLQVVAVSPDTWVDLSGTILPDNNVGFDLLNGAVNLGVCAPLCAPLQADLDGYELVTDTQALVSFDTAVEVPAIGGGTLTLSRGDVGLADVGAGGYVLVFDASSAGLPASSNTDAVTLASQGSTSSLLLSFDITVELGGSVYDDEDLVLWDGATFSMAFDGSASGMAQGLDLDAAFRIQSNGHLLLSFDGGGTLGGVIFDDEDLLEFDPGPGTWQMAYDGSALHAGWAGADLNAAWADPDSDGDGEPDSTDCEPTDPDVFSGAPEILDGKDNQCPGDPCAGDIDEVCPVVSPPNTKGICWSAMAGVTAYEVIVCNAPELPCRPASVSCSKYTTSDLCLDVADPNVGQTNYVVVRPALPTAGTWGLNSAGIARNPFPGNVLDNSDFEVGVCTSAQDRINSPGTIPISPGALQGNIWQVTSGNVELVCDLSNTPNPRFTPRFGVRTVDLNGNNVGTIEQTVPTQPGVVYEVTFWLAGNSQGLPLVKTLDVSAAADSTSFVFDIGTIGADLEVEAWDFHIFTFTATESTTTIEFASTSTFFGQPSHGPLLDNITVAPAGVCQTPVPTCSDGQKNGEETDIDCGGSVCAACTTGQNCISASDCDPAPSCTLNVCEATCSDAVQDQDETDIDCGGSTCPACMTGQSCISGSDCDDAVCTGNLCQAPTCSDGVQNQDETDVDCGGTCGSTCSDGATCQLNEDCVSLDCGGGLCRPVTCSDGVLNGDETDVDCGGACGTTCSTGEMCQLNTDCFSLNCSGGLCQAECDAVNGALGQPVAQSSTCFGFVAERAVDGISGNATSTCNDVETEVDGDFDRWQVDLGADRKINSVSIFNRGACCKSRLRDIIVSVYADGTLTGVSDLSVGATAVFESTLLNPENILGGGISGEGPDTLDLDLLAIPTAGRYVRVTRVPDPDNSGSSGSNNAEDDDTLALGEVQVFVCEIPTCSDGVQNQDETGVDCGGTICPGC